MIDGTDSVGQGRELLGGPIPRPVGRIGRAHALAVAHELFEQRCAGNGHGASLIFLRIVRRVVVIIKSDFALDLVAVTGNLKLVLVGKLETPNGQRIGREGAGLVAGDQRA